MTDNPTKLVVAEYTLAMARTLKRMAADHGLVHLAWPKCGEQR
jgi:hypothetical protein